MKILVTGGAGFIGSAVVRNLISSTDCQVLNLDKLTYAASLSAIGPASTSDRYTFVEGDICDRNLVELIIGQFKPTMIMHLAAESHVDRSIDAPGAFMTTNVIGTFTLLEGSLAYWNELPPIQKGEFRFTTYRPMKYLAI